MGIEGRLTSEYSINLNNATFDLAQPRPRLNHANVHSIFTIKFEPSPFTELVAFSAVDQSLFYDNNV